MTYKILRDLDLITLLTSSSTTFSIPYSALASCCFSHTLSITCLYCLCCLFPPPRMLFLQVFVWPTPSLPLCLYYLCALLISYPKTQWLKRTSIYYLILCLRLRNLKAVLLGGSGFHEVGVRMAAGNAVTIRGWRIHFQALSHGFWQEVPFPCPWPLHGAAHMTWHDMTLASSRARDPRETERPRRRLQSSYNLISEVTSHYYIAVFSSLEVSH